MQILRDRRVWAIAGVVVIAVVAAAVALVRGGDDPATSRFTSATATLSVIGGDVQVVSEDGASVRAGQDGEALVTGTIVEAQAPDGRAVLTFRDGSTVELEPQASVRIDEHSLGTRGELLVRLHQDRGKTWSHVQPQLSPNSRFHVKTPSTTVVVRSTSFEVDVSRVNGTPVTRVTVFEGTADLVAGGAVVSVPASHASEVVAGGAPRPAERISRSDLCMRIEVTTEALMTVTDPADRTSGQTALGTVSQIPKAIVTGSQTEPQVVEIFSPTAGEWEIGIVPRNNGGPLHLLAYTVVDGQVVHRAALAMTIDRGQRVITNLRLDPDGRSGSFAPPVESTATRAVALPSGTTTTAPLPQARLFEPSHDPLALACVPADELERPSGVKPVPSPEQTSGR